MVLIINVSLGRTIPVAYMFLEIWQFEEGRGQSKTVKQKF